MKYITLGTSVIVLSIFALQCAWSTPVRAEESEDFKIGFNGNEIVETAEVKKVGEPRVIERVPLFDNLPFLKLKAGDKLVKGKYWKMISRTGEGNFSENENYYLMSGGKYYVLDASEQGKKLTLTSHYSLLFDWEVSLANATRLLEDFIRHEETIELKSFVRLKTALQKEFPEILREEGEIQITRPYLEGEGTKRRAVFQGTGFDRFHNTVFKYQFEIGNNTFIQYRKNLIIGPRRVQRQEFEGWNINGQILPPPNPEAAAKARVAYDRMIAFQTFVNKFLVAPRIEPKPGTGKGGFGFGS